MRKHLIGDFYYSNYELTTKDIKYSDYNGLINMNHGLIVVAKIQLFAKWIKNASNLNSINIFNMTFYYFYCCKISFVPRIEYNASFIYGIIINGPLSTL